jgi:hypothetical protein
MNESVAFGRRGGQRDPRIIDAEPPSPPSPPLQGKLWRFYRHQMVGIPLLLIITIAAMAGLFGDTESTTTKTEGDLEARLVVPNRFRFKMIGPLTLKVTNRGRDPIEATMVRISRPYLEEFSNVRFSPAESHISGEWHVFELGEIAPGDSVVITGEIQAESFGAHRGSIEVQSDDTIIELEAETWAFP